MKILFISKYYPARFQNILLYFSLKNTDQVHFFSEYRHKKLSHKNIIYTNIRFPKVYYKGNKAEQNSIRLLRRGLIFSNALLRLKNTGFTPDFIFLDSNHATSFSLHRVFPNVPTICFCDWFIPEDELNEELSITREEEDPFLLSHGVNNMFQMETIRHATKLITFSQYQKKSYPEFLQKKMTIINEGINTDFFSPAKKDIIPDYLKGYEENDLILFAPRVFKKTPEQLNALKALKTVFNENPSARVLMLTKDKTSQEDFNEIFSEFEKILSHYKDRIILHTNATIEEYRAALIYSKIHLFFFDQLFVNSSFYEALACSSLVIAQDHPALEEFIIHGTNGYLSNYKSDVELSKLMLEILSDNEKQNLVRVQARKYSSTRFSFKTEVNKLLKIISTLEQKEIEE